jgi:uncharacterized membrane protein
MNIGRDVTRLLKRGRRMDERLPYAAGAAGIGAGLMYLLDPDRGARRRALVRDKSVHAVHRLNDLLDKSARDLTYRARGLAAEARSTVRHQHVSDEVLVERVRAQLGRVVSHPHAIKVHAVDGCVTLEGPVLADEAAPLLSRAGAVPGVRGVDDRLEPHQACDAIPALQGRARRAEPRAGHARARWSPIARLAAGVAGGWLVAYGISKRGALGALAAGAGAALLARDVADRPLRRLLGIGAGRRAVDFHKTIHVHAPVEEVYAFFTDVENFPRFMAHVRDVKKIGDERYHWVAEGPARIPVTWDAEITERVPHEVFAWRSVPGAVIANAGIVHFERCQDGGTRLDLRMSYNPPAGAVGHVVASIFGADPKHALDEDLVRFQSLLERGKTTAHGAPVRIEEIAAKA